MQIGTVVFLAVILDVFSRRVVGWARAKNIDHHLTVAALRTRTRTPNLIGCSQPRIFYCHCNKACG